MGKIAWDRSGERLFESGVDRGVLYPTNRKGVAWNGLTAVTEAPSGGSPKAYYIDGVRYVNVPTKVEHTGSISAFTYPDEFAECDGTKFVHAGLEFTGQARSSFGLSYRTAVGNDLKGIDFGYKIHLIYNALTEPTSKSYSTSGETLDPDAFTWKFTTTPVEAGPGQRPMSHVVINSTKTPADTLARIEDILYGSETSDSYLPTPLELIDIFGPIPDLLEVTTSDTGVYTVSGNGVNEYEDGSFTIEHDSVNSAEDGSFTIE